MSEARVRILADVKGLDSIDRLKNAFRGLEQAIGPTDQTISRARASILAYGEAGKRSEQVVLGQIQALKGLREQAEIGGKVYKDLVKDIQSLSGAYDQVANSAKKASDAQIKSRALSKTPSQAERQIALLKQELSELDALSDGYTKLQSQIINRENISGARAGRQSVIAGARAFDENVFDSPFRSSVQLQMPDTTAALTQRAGELSLELSNLERNSSKYTTTAIELASVQKQLQQNLIGVSSAYRRMALDEESAIRRAEKLAGVQRDAAKAPSVGGYRDPETGAIIARGSNDRSGYKFDQNFGPNYGPAEPSQLFQAVTESRLASASNKAQLMGKSFQEVANEIRLTAKASDGATTSLQAQRNAWTSLAGAVEKGGEEYKEAQKEIQAVDKRLNPGTGRLKRIGETAGAVAASGIFGGPEGLIGAGIGAFLGPQGALAGGAIGAQVGQVRQAIGGTAEYSASLERLKIALQGVAGNSKEFAAAQGVISRASKELNSPVLETTQGFTRLAASVKGAGGNVADAEVVYRGVSQAIKATGGSSEDAQSAILAMSQVFSKGKVSAEELGGQLGERLPGAVTLFAKATGRTLPQLAKDLQSGTVGLNDLIKFTQELSKRYATDAEKIAKSSQESGARMMLAWSEVKKLLGDVFQPIGAGIQDVTTKLLEMAAAALEAAGAFGQAFNARSQAFRDANKKFGLTGKITDVGTQVSPEYWNFVDTRYNEIQAANDAKNAVAASSGALTNFRDRKPGAEGNPDTSPALRDQLALALAQEQAARSTYKTNVELARTDQLRVAFSAKIVEYNKIERDFAEGKLRAKEKEYKILTMESEYRTRVNAINRQAQEEQQRQAEKTRADALQQQKNREQELTKATDALIQLRQTNEAFDAFGKNDLEALQQKLASLKITDELEQFSLERKAAAAQAEAQLNGTAQETYLVYQRQRAELEQTQAIRKRNTELQIVELYYANAQAKLARQQTAENERYQAKASVRGLQVGILKSLGRSTTGLGREELSDQQQQRRAEMGYLEAAIENNRNEIRSYNDRGGRSKFAEQIDSLNKEIAAQEASLRLKQAQIPVMEQLELKQQQLNEFAERYGGIFDSIGQGLTKTFDLLITGTDNWGNSLRTIASTVLQDVARQLLKVLVIDQAISAFRGLFSPVKSVGGGLNLAAIARYDTVNAMGNAYASNGIVPFATGGIVDRPTLFPFAKGIGLMGEAGPEGILPLRRGKDGRLGVTASGGSGSGAPITVNVSVDAKGSSVQGDGSQGAALGRAIAGAVQAELIKARRPGGILAS